MAKKHGFDAIELNVDEVGESKHAFSFDTTADELAEVLALSKKHNIKVHGVSSSLYWKYGAFACQNEEKRDEAIKIIRTQLRCAKALGAGAILVVTCIDDEIGLKASFDNTIKVFRSLKSEIAESGVKVGLENVWNQFFMSPYDVKYILEEIDDENVGMYFDVGNMIEWHKAEWWVDVIGKNIVRVHIKDFKNNNGFHSGGDCTKLLEGEVNFEALLPKLAKVYDGPLTAEFFQNEIHPEGDIPDDDFIKEIAVPMDKVMEMAK